MQKIALVDGHSLNHIAKDLGYDAVSALGLHQLLSHVGKGTLTHKPLLTYYKGFETNAIVENFKLAGFCVEFTNEKEDDELLIQHIHNTDVCEIQELILVTQDSDFLGSVLSKRSEGLQIYWVGSLGARNNGTQFPSLGYKLRKSFCRNPCFVEIDDPKYGIFYNRKRRTIA